MVYNANIMPYETGYAPTPVALEDPLTHIDVAAQLAVMETQLGFTPVEAHSIGSLAIGTLVEKGEVRDRPPEAGARDVAEEMWHSYTPFNAENTVMYGSETERLQAAETVSGIAAQAALTGKYFDGRQKRLGRELADGKITQDQHDEAVGSILMGLALTNPAHLRSVGEAQRAAIDRRVKAGALPAETKFVEVTSRVTENGVELAGIDAVVAKMTGARTQAEVAQNGLDLKKQFYSQENLIKATARHDRRQAELAIRDQAAFEAEFRRTIDLLDKEDEARKAAA
jgi:hypothetical protein